MRGGGVGGLAELVLSSDRDTGVRIGSHGSKDRFVISVSFASLNLHSDLYCQYSPVQLLFMTSSTISTQVSSHNKPVEISLCVDDGIA